jgi:undecaprenyl-diphosphatase
LLVALTLGVAVLLLSLLAIHPEGSGLQRVDNAAERYVVTHRSAALTWVADEALNEVVGARGLLLIRVLATLWLGFRRRWWALAAFVLIYAVSDASTELMKHALSRPRPTDSLVHVTGLSFPSGQTVAITATTIALVLLLVPPGAVRRILLGLALALSLAVAWSRVYLGAHWLSDTVAGVLLGACLAVGIVAGIQAVAHVRPGTNARAPVQRRRR